ncbi:unnamed protein product, partial [marine sediment metagenome]
EAAYSYAGTTLVINPLADFLPGETVTATVTDAVEGTDGNQLEEEYAFTLNMIDAAPTPIEVGGTLSSSTLWTSDNVYYLTSDLTIPSGVTLVIEPGTVVKFSSYKELNVDGMLLAQGTTAEQIVFTVYWDDTYGGDTGDGSYSWDTIRLNGDGSILDHVLVRNGGWYSSSGRSSMVYLNSNSVVRNSTLENQHGSVTLASAAVSIGSMGQLRDSLIRSNTYGVRVTSSSAILVGNTITGNIYPVAQTASSGAVDYSGNDLAG